MLIGHTSWPKSRLFRRFVLVKLPLKGSHHSHFLRVQENHAEVWQYSTVTCHKPGYLFALLGTISVSDSQRNHWRSFLSTQHKADRCQLASIELPRPQTLQNCITELSSSSVHWGTIESARQDREQDLPTWWHIRRRKSMETKLCVRICKNH